jgi:hypothetical protein
MKARASYEVKKWDEETYQQLSPEMKMTRASVEFAMRGEIACTANVQYLMFYKKFDPADQHKASAVYVGLMKMDGKVSGKSGSFALEDRGTYEAGLAKSSLKIIEGSGTGELKGIKGTAAYHASQAGFNFELDYSLP